MEAKISFVVNFYRGFVLKSNSYIFGYSHNIMAQIGNPNFS